MGAEVAVFRRGDHHRFTPAELSEAAAIARREGRRIVTTEKDLQRLPADFAAEAARLDLEWEDSAWTSAIDSAFA
jgi:tetraacyldisaccharide 4'-kinase